MPDEYLEFDTNALLRSSFKEMIDALANGTRRIFAPNEARAMFDLPAQEGGDQILVQQQDIPLSMAGKSAAPIAGGAASDVPVDPSTKSQEDEDDESRDFDAGGYTIGAIKGRLAHADPGNR
jgi:hypothetical protein